MSVGVQGFDGYRLQQARKARGLTAVELAEATSISSASISAYEKEKQKPQQDVLDRLALALGLSTAYFMSNDCQRVKNNLFYRSMASATKAARVQAEAKYEWTLDVIEYLLEFFDFPPLNLPELDVPDDFRDLTDQKIEAIAMQVRSHWNLGVGPITNVVRTLESNGIVVWRTNFCTERLDAFSEFRTPHPVVVLSNDKNNFFRSRFDASHELGHLILHRNVDRTALTKSSEFKLLEDQAHLFAGAFLLPATSYAKDLWHTSVDAFRALKPRWNVTIGMQIMRSKHLGLVGSNQESRLWINLSRRGWRKKEPLDDSTEIELPNLINRSLRMLIDERVKSGEQIAHDLCLPANQIEEIGSLPKGCLSGNSHEPTARLKGANNILPFRR